MELNFTEKEVEYLKVSIEKLFKDAQYFNRYEQEVYAKKLMQKVAEAEHRNQELEELLSNLGDIDDEFEII